MTPKAVFEVRRLVIVFALFLSAAIAASLFFNIRSTVLNHEELGRIVGQTLFWEMAVTRRWNAQHGGVYLVESEEVRPNPFLEDPYRDLTTREGLKLTKLNPSYMTRLLAELTEREGGVGFHLTSLNPINPGNGPDEWERAALEGFAAGKTESFAVVRTGSGPVFRYIAPLTTEESCLTCHAKQGYRLGDVRGGLAVSFNYAPFERALRTDLTWVGVVHLAFSMMLLLVTFVLGRRLVRSVGLIKRLEGLLPVCSHCKKIRPPESDPKDPANWVAMEQFIGDRTDTEFSHSICPDCARKLYPYFYRDKSDSSGGDR